MEKIKVFLADPQVLFREGIHFILSGEEDFEVIGETTGNEEALSLIETNPPNVAVLSIHDARLAGADVCSRIRRNMPSVYVILIMDKKEPDKVFGSLKGGASATLTKDTDPEHLLNIIRIVSQGSLPIIEEMFNPAIASMVLTEFEDLDALNEQFDNLLANLTPREKQIFTLIAAGTKIEQISVKIDSDEDSIRHSMRIVLTKLIANEQTRNIIEAAQRSMPSLIRSGRLAAKTNDYVSKTEFNEFKDSLMDRLKTFIGELAPVQPVQTKVKK